MRSSISTVRATSSSCRIWIKNMKKEKRDKFAENLSLSFFLSFQNRLIRTVTSRFRFLSLLKRIDKSGNASQDEKQACKQHDVVLDGKGEACRKQQNAQNDEGHTHGREGMERFFESFIHIFLQLTIIFCKSTKNIWLIQEKVVILHRNS